MVKKINRDKPEKPTKAVKPVVAGKPKSAEKKAVVDKPAKDNATKKRDVSDRSAGDRSSVNRPVKSPVGKPAYKSAQSPKPKVTQDTDGKTLTPAAPSDEKLQKVLARAGIGSRREMERAIESGQVKVNDKVAKLGDRVMPHDKIFVNGHRVVLRSELTRRRVILYNKPEGEICSRSDPEGRPTVYDHLPSLKGERWISVGRLDFNTSGLLLFTNDGELANKLMHPASVIDREYLVRIQGEVTDEMRASLLKGVVLDDGIARFTDIVDGAGEGKNRWFYCVVMEGRNREVRRLWESQGVKVSRLKRVRYANIFIPSHVRVGQWTDLTEREIQDLCMTAGFDSSTYTRMMEPTRDEQAQRERHDKKLRAASAAPRRTKAPVRKRPPIVE